MTTPVAQTETLEEVAERIVRTYCAVIDGVKLTAIERELSNQILSALRARDERAAEIADKYVADMRSVTRRTEYGEGRLNAAVRIAKQIRSRKDGN